MSQGRPDQGPLSDAALDRLRVAVEEPLVAGTRYELRDLVGRGGMGSVWRAFDRELERDVALKVLFDVSGGSAAAERLIAEARVLARLEHPGIVPVHDAGVLPDGRVFCAMKLVRGPSLDQLIGSGLAPSERFRIFARIGETIAFAHARGVLHRDLKPQNIMVGEFGEVLVLDWGLAAMAEGGSALRAGTPGYMAPEQQRGEPVDARCDVFALGRLLHALWRGDVPSRTLSAVAAKATADDPADRYASALDLAAEVARVQLDEPVQALPESFWRRVARHLRRHHVAYWVVGSYLLLRLAFVLWRQRFGS